MADKPDRPQYLVTLRSPMAVVQSGQLRALQTFVGARVCGDEVLTKGPFMHHDEFVSFQTSRVFVPQDKPLLGPVMAASGAKMALVVEVPVSNVAAVVPWTEIKGDR